MAAIAEQPQQLLKAAVITSNCRFRNGREKKEKRIHAQKSLKKVTFTQ